MRRDGKGLDKGLSGSYWMGRLTARVIERASECHPPQELQMKKEIPSLCRPPSALQWEEAPKSGIYHPEALELDGDGGREGGLRAVVVRRQCHLSWFGYAGCHARQVKYVC